MIKPLTIIPKIVIDVTLHRPSNINLIEIIFRVKLLIYKPEGNSYNSQSLSQRVNVLVKCCPNVNKLTMWRRICCFNLKIKLLSRYTKISLF